MAGAERRTAEGQHPTQAAGRAEKPPDLAFLWQKQHSPPTPVSWPCSCHPPRPPLAQLCERRPGRARRQQGRGQRQGWGLGGRPPPVPWQQGWGSRQLLGQVEQGGQESGREHQAAAAPAWCHLPNKHNKRIPAGSQGRLGSSEVPAIAPAWRWKKAGRKESLCLCQDAAGQDMRGGVTGGGEGGVPL